MIQRIPGVLSRLVTALHLAVGMIEAQCEMLVAARVVIAVGVGHEVAVAQPTVARFGDLVRAHQRQHAAGLHARQESIGAVGFQFVAPLHGAE